MRISEAGKITRLTKKAIRYYEEEGLIKPYINNENSYREYSEDDIEKLKLISLYRNMDMSMDIIKRLLNSDKKADILEEYLLKVKDRIREMEIIQETLNELIKGSSSISEFNDNIVRHRRDEKDYVLNSLSKIFPGAFGKYIMIHFGEFLDEPLDSMEKRVAFEKIIEYLDNSEELEIEYPQQWKQSLEDIDEVKLLEAYTDTDNRMKELAGIDDDGVEKLKKEIESYIDMQNSDEYREQFELMNSMKLKWADKLKKNGYYDVFINNLKILSPKYKKYADELQALSQRLQLVSDENGRIMFDKKKTDSFGK